MLSIPPSPERVCTDANCPRLRTLAGGQRHPWHDIQAEMAAALRGAQGQAAEPERVTFGVRRMHAGDSAFVYANFLEPFRESDYVDGIPNTEFYSTYKAEWARVLATFTVLIAHPEGAEDEIAGFLAYRGHNIGWIYTKKKPWRGMGAARTLMEVAGFPPAAPLWALYGSSWGLRWFRRAGYVINLTPHASAERLLLGVGP